jgi:hypothetical protein
MGDNFSPSMFSEHPKTTQLGKQTAKGLENFSLPSEYAAKSLISKQSPSYSG